MGTLQISANAFEPLAAAESVPAVLELTDCDLVAHAAIEAPQRMSGRKLFITTRDDMSTDAVLRLPGIRQQFDRAPEPKQLVLLDGSAHAQFVFET